VTDDSTQPLVRARHLTEWLARIDAPRARLAGGMMTTRLAAVCVLVSSCAPAPMPTTTNKPPPPTSASASATTSVAPPAPPAGDPLVLVTETAALRALEEKGYDLGTLLDGAAARDNAQLAKGKRFANVVARLDQDLAEAKAADPAAGVGMAKAHRLFDVRWLRSQSARFELIGVSNRLDRRPFATVDGTCGEVRFVYRLAYATTAKDTAIASRLPATIAFTAWVREADCAAAAKRWLVPKDADLVAHLTGKDGPLARPRVSSFRSLELNVQRVRWPSTIRPDLGGHAEYLMRVFEETPAGDLFVGKLENTPDVAALKNDPKKRAALVAWLTRPENLERLDRGTLVIPREFLASSALSVSPRGLARRSNRAFRQLFEPSDFAQAKLDGHANIATPAAVIRRLDALTCNGCHQSRTVAGFHLLGAETAPAGSANAITVGDSPHLDVDLIRRTKQLVALAAGAKVDDSAPFPERDPSVAGGYGAHCGLGDKGFAAWTCEKGLVCDAGEGEVGDEIGTCLPPSPKVGDPCEVGLVTPKGDKIAKLTKRTCDGAAVCEDNRVGFPAGMCSTTCAALGPDGVCGGIPFLVGFNDCLGQNTPFEKCIASNIRPAGLRACSASAPCRDDYVCARTASGKGACMPPYFLFQLRVDGHP